ncbi:DUF2235 domain-containing protein [Methylophaga lonarensis]|uniref:DUF2235 domain-containing protein n=1 Tax=Methylophaga lonarensis TaxID=999151 RepID=UPI003D2A9754
MTPPKQRLVILFDGTWNDPQDRTNVYQMSRHIEPVDGEIRQRFYYEPGVGTGRFEKFRGGVFGYGLTKNLLQGYDWLIRNYHDNFEVFIFGFSRGAYTARSLAGLINKCGLLEISRPDLLQQAEQLYRNKSLGASSPECVEFRAQYSRRIKIDFLGVWDTVGALGVPGTMISERGRYAWHDTELSNIVLRAYQAMALDEHRAAYDSVLWTSHDGIKDNEQIDIEQRWFIGAHANVGGGYGDDLLADIAFAWMHQKADAAGLKLKPYSPPVDAFQGEPRDSFAEFLRGSYGFFRRITRRGDGRFIRAFASNHLGEPAVNVTIDPSVWQRWQAVSDYRPATLVNAEQSPPD